MERRVCQVYPYPQEVRLCCQQSIRAIAICFRPLFLLLPSIPYPQLCLKKPTQSLSRPFCARRTDELLSTLPWDHNSQHVRRHQFREHAKRTYWAVRLRPGGGKAMTVRFHQSMYPLAGRLMSQLGSYPASCSSIAASKKGMAVRKRHAWLLLCNQVCVWSV